MNRFKLIQESVSGGSGSNVIAFIVLFVLVAVFIAYALIYNYLKKKYNFKLIKKINAKRRDFYGVGNDIGLNSEEIKKLFNLVFDYDLKYPMTCFTSAKALDDVLKKGLTAIDKNKSLTEEEKNYNNSLILEIKAKIEANTRKNTGIRSTHFMAENQKIIIFSRGKGYIYANVIRIVNEYLIIELISKKINKRIFSKHEYLKIYFWRERDAGYIFESAIINLGENVRVYSIRHSDKLIRSQKRKYRRIPVNIVGELYPVYSKLENNKKIYTIGDKKARHCNLLDLSAGGLKLKTNEIEEKDKIVKIDFNLNRYNLATIGKVIRFHQHEDGTKDITLQFLKINLKNKNIINRYVYNYLPGYV